MAQLELAPTLAVFASRSVISKRLRFAKDFSAPATLVIFAGTHLPPTSDAERDQVASQKPFEDSIRESRIASSPSDKLIDSTGFPAVSPRGLRVYLIASTHFDSFVPVESGIRPVNCTGSELVLLIFEQDVERGERSVTARDVLLQLELVRFT